eukprot:RCo005286
MMPGRDVELSLPAPPLWSRFSETALEVDARRRSKRLQWLSTHGSKEEILQELRQFSLRIDELSGELLARQHSVEAAYLRSMTAGRRRCQFCGGGCEKYVPGECARCGCPPLLHEKLPFTRAFSENLPLRRSSMPNGPSGAPDLIPAERRHRKAPPSPGGDASYQETASLVTLNLLDHPQTSV